MSRSISTFLAGLAFAGILPLTKIQAKPTPNIIWIMADDLGYGDLGCYGQRVIQTPRLDQMAAEGLKWTQFYAGATVCAPSRCVLMTGKHLGHASVRGNGTGAEQALEDSDYTVAELLKEHTPYQTALIGKWGLGDMRPETESGMPNRQGFDTFFGYANQVHAHNYYPDFLWRNETPIQLPNVVQLASRAYGGFHGGAATRREVYSHDLFIQESLQWIEKNKANPFFLYLSLTIPHANNEGSAIFGDGAEVPDYGIYSKEDWPNPDKGQAAMITRMDQDVGRILDHLKALNLDQNTLVLFTSDNGPHNEARHHPERFQPSGPLRGMKRDLMEGGIRVPMICWWPGTIRAGRVTDHIAYFGDFMATVCDLVQVAVPCGLDSLSFAPTLFEKSQAQHDYLYWEFYERGGSRAIREGRWKAIRSPWDGALQLYDLNGDIGETRDLSAQFPDISQHLIKLMDFAHQPTTRWNPTERIRN